LDSNENDPTTPSLRAEIEARLSPAIDHVALRAVARAVAELRRGDPVVVAASGGAVLLRTVEGVTDDDLARLKALAGAVPKLAVTGMRGQALGLEVGTGAAAVLLSMRGGLPAERMRALAGPDVPAVASTPLAGLAVEPVDGEDGIAAGILLAKLARLLPAVAAVALRDGGDPAGFAAANDLVPVRAGDVLDYHTHAARTLALVGEARVPLEDAEATRVLAFRPADGGIEHLAIVIGEPDPAAPVLVRIHSECFTGDLLGSLRCDCGDQLRGAIAEIGRRGAGIVLYLAQEGRGIGLVNKLRAYRLQDTGFDTVDANERLGFDADERIYLPAAEMLRQLGFGAVRLMTNNPDKLRQLARCGIQVAERVPHVFPGNGHNEAYLRTKAERSGHLF
jgi:GTP cyclohydrolase II